MKKIILVAASVLLSVFAASAQDLKQANEIAAQANDAIQLNDMDSALNYYKEAISLAENSEEEGAAELTEQCKTSVLRILLQQGKDQYKLKNYDAALEKFNETIETAQAYGNEEYAEQAAEIIPNVKMNKANSMLTSKDYEGASALLTEILEEDPTNGAAALRLGMAQAGLGNLDSAKEAYKTAYENGQEKNAGKQLANICLKQSQSYLKAKDYTAASEAAAESNSYVESANAYKLAASAATQLKDNDGIISNYEKYLELAPNAKDANGVIYTLAVIYQNQGNKTKALEYYQQIASDSQYGEAARAQIQALSK